MSKIFKVTNPPGKPTVQWQQPKVIISDGFLQDIIDATAKWNFNRQLRRAGLKAVPKKSIDLQTFHGLDGMYDLELFLRKQLKKAGLKTSYKSRRT